MKFRFSAQGFFPGFFSGLASLFTAPLHATENPSTALTASEKDVLAMRSDWISVGKSFEHVLGADRHKRF